MAALVCSSCATPIADFQSCAGVPAVINGVLKPLGGGGSCDYFFESDPVTYTQAELDAMLLSWEQAGDAVEMIRSSALKKFKAEIEKLCTVGKCTEPVKQAIHNFFLKVEVDEFLVKYKVTPR